MAARARANAHPGGGFLAGFLHPIRKFWRRWRSARWPVAIHGLEAPAARSAALWWLGAFTGSVLVSGGGFRLLRSRPLAWTRGAALLLALCGGVAALEPAGG